jgi:hypothetical protein
VASRRIETLDWHCTSWSQDFGKKGGGADRQSTYSALAVMLGRNEAVRMEKAGRRKAGKTYGSGKFRDFSSRRIVRLRRESLICA